LVDILSFRGEEHNWGTFELGTIWPIIRVKIYMMKGLDIQVAIGAAVLLLSLPCDAKHSHGLSHLDILRKRHGHKGVHASPRAEGSEDILQKRGTCAFPTNAGLVAVTPGSENAGWAMSPNQPCTPGNFCPYACPPGQLMAQWNPLATSYTYPLSMVCRESEVKN